MKNEFKIFVILGILILTNQDSIGNWLMSGNNITNDQKGMQTQYTPNTQHTQHTQHLQSDTLPEGFSDETMNDLRDNNGNRIFPDDGGDAFQNRTFTGSAALDLFGFSVSSAGDVNLDGYDDLIIGAFGNDAAGSEGGRAYIYFGGINVNSIADVVLSGEGTDNNFGISVSDAGDVNGDGYPDVIVGASKSNSYTGKAYIYYGGSAMNNAADVILTGEGVNTLFGYSVSAAGDVNGDGFSDVLVGAYTYSSSKGRAYLFYGSASMNSDADVTFTGETINNYFGKSLSSAGDLNGDGYSDIVIGAYRYNNYTGKAYVYFGGSSMDDVADLTMIAEDEFNSFGISVSGADDVNGDGYSDLVIGAEGFNSGTGRTYLYYGSSSMDNTADVIMNGETNTNSFGGSVSNAGDVNGDGYSDIVIGAYNHNNAVGKVYVYYGGTSMNNSADLSMTGEASFSNYGNSVSGAGDMNGDGYSDLIVGAHNLNSQTGRSYLYMYGMTGTLISELNISGDVTLHEVGASVSSAGDVNGDGYDDVIIGAPYSAGAGFGGDAYIFFGGINMDNIADVTLGGEAANNRFGASVSTAGDVNGDGYSDVIVGAWAYSSQRGRAYIYYGGAVMNAVADVVMTGASPSNNFGASVSTAGDVNADGYSDVIIGAYGYSAYTGLAYIFYGGASMNNVSDVFMIGEASNNNFGYSVSSAGDLNGDGYSDVIAGAYGYSANKGKSYIYFGGSSMDNAADIAMEGGATDDAFGFSVSSAGDVNGDGFSDAIIGSHGYNSAMGRAYIFYGGMYMNNAADVTMTGETTINNFGISVSSAGDVNRDGYSDVIVGASRYNTYTGRAFVFYGSPNMNNTEDRVITGEGVNTEFGRSVSSAGDLNGDGNSDIIVGAPFTNNSTGKNFIYFNSSPNVHPNILSVNDVAGDQGGYLNLKFSRSAFDVPLSETGGINYQIERSVPPNISGYQWISAATVSGTHNAVYTAEVHTPLDSGISGNNTYFFRITAVSNSIGSIWRSNILSGHSIDNLAPLPPVNLTAVQSGNNIDLNWFQNSENDLKHYIVLRNGIQIGTSTTLNFTDINANPDSVNVYEISAEDIHGNISGLSNPASVTIIYTTVNIKVIPQGFYNTGTEKLNMRDTVKVYIHSNSSPYYITDSAVSVIDSITFSGKFRFLNAVSGTYYFKIKHRNSIETWSRTGGEYIVSGSTSGYDFTDNVTKAYGSNMTIADAVPLRYSVFGGDIDQDGNVNLTDVLLAYNDANTFVTGYAVSDVTGNNITDLSDVILTYNNSNLFISKVSP